jgi:hypothetical protein
VDDREVPLLTHETRVTPSLEPRITARWPDPHDTTI